jgi:hypothetical protein
VKDNLNMIAETHTRWVKIWVDLPSLWPDSGLNYTLLGQLDYQIGLAKVYGCGVILTISHDLPHWINNSSDTRRLPEDTSLGGPWTQMFNYFAVRYNVTNPSRPYSGWSYVDVIEFCNEPNLLAHSNGIDDLPTTIAVLFKRAKQIISYYNNLPFIGGPATSDVGPDKVAGRRNYYDFTTDVLSHLNSNGFYSVGNNTSCLWTHHNYTDVSCDHGANTIAPDRATYYTGQGQFDRFHLRSGSVTELLGNLGWKGWPNGQSTNPRMFLTEGGAFAQKVNPFWGLDGSEASFQIAQNNLVSRSLTRLSTDDVGFGVDMFTQYLFYTDPNYDNGLCQTNGTRRMVYGTTWQPYPGRL